MRLKPMIIRLLKTLDRLIREWFFPDVGGEG